MEYAELYTKLEELKNPKNVEGMMRFGVRPKTTMYGISIPDLRILAKKIGKNNQLALKLWDSNIHEARILAGYIAEPEKVTEKQFKKWVGDFDSWDICDQVCGNLFDKTQFASYKNILALSKARPEFIKRTAFTLMACLAVHDKTLKDKNFIRFFPLIKKESVDERNFVKKALNWALRQIGKRNTYLNKQAIVLAKEIRQLAVKSNSKSARWVSNDAIRELESPGVRKRVLSL